MTIISRITALWPTTEALLIADATVGYSTNRDRAVTDAISSLWRVYAPVGAVPPGDVADSLPATQQQVAEMAVLQLIPGAQDWYAQDPLRQGPEGGDVTMQDQVKRLDNLAAALRLSIATREREVAADIRTLTGATTVPFLPPPLFTLATGGRGG